MPELLNQNIKKLSTKANNKRYDKYFKIYPKLIEIECLNNEIIKKLKNSYQKELREYFKINNLKSEEKYNCAVDFILTGRRFFYNEFLKYIKRMKVESNILDSLLKGHKKEINRVRKEYKICQDKIYKCKVLTKKILKYNIFFSLRKIFPNKKYAPYPLKDAYTDYKFSKDIEKFNNVCCINIEFSNLNRNWIGEYSPIKVDYIIKIDNKIDEKKNLFVSSVLDNFLKQSKMKYYEKYYGEKYVFNPIRFSPTTFQDYISVNMEFRTGINEYTISQYSPKYKLNDILKEISKQINDDTKVILVSSGYKKLLLGYEEELEGLSHNLKRKILLCIRK